MDVCTFGFKGIHFFFGKKTNLTMPFATVSVAHSTVSVAVSACVLPFIPTAIIKAVLACVLGLNIRKRIPGVKKA